MIPRPRSTDPTDPTNMSPEERFTEVACILAAGVLRLRQRQAMSTPDATVIRPIESVESAANGLEVPSETRLHGHRD
jgi:hypothetical protein